ncbi:MAG: hypothetical protein NTX48_07880 [Planctomycetales bacterium]|nr:hypothetical protein [Planctomycetales bacterium]
MPRKKPKPPESIELDGLEGIEELKRQIQRSQDVWNFDYLTSRLQSHAERILANSHTSAGLIAMAKQAIDWLALLKHEMETGTPRAIAVRAIKLGALAEKMQAIDFLAYGNWPTVKQTAEILDVEVATVSKLVKYGVLQSNGKRGKGQILISPVGILRRLKQTGRLDDPTVERIAEITPVLQDQWDEFTEVARRQNGSRLSKRLAKIVAPELTPEEIPEDLFEG